MRIIKVSATESTNKLAREWYAANKDSGPVVIVTNHQTAGRGQRGATWISNAGENLTMSIFYPRPKVEIAQQFHISAGVGLAVIRALKILKINKVSLKWPNDILAANKKIGGILIENILSNGRISASVIGLGLNVNQEVFEGLPQAASLKTVSGKKYDLEEVLAAILESLENFLDDLGKASPGKILKEYENVLFRKDKISTFKLPSGDLISGKIEGITSTGLLKVRVEEFVVRTFDLKEIKLLF